jgi:predicted SAM-dependent methyltransferase
MAKKKKAEPVPPVEKQLIKLDIACGQRKQPGHVGLDIAPCEGVDIVHNLSHYPWPVESESVSEAFSSHYIEHIPLAYWNPDNTYSPEMKDNKSVDALCKFFEECYRILAPGGKLTLIAPYYANQRCWQDPTHRRAVCDSTFYYVSKEWRKQNGLDHYGMDCDFHATWGYGLDPSQDGKSDEYRAFAFKHYMNAISDIHATLVKK